MLTACKYLESVSIFLLLTLSGSSGSLFRSRICAVTNAKDLPETYKRALSRIVKAGNGEIADRIFRWVAAAKRPYDLRNYGKQSQLNPETHFLQRDRLVNDINRMVPCCGSLVASDEEDLLVQFVHYTVKQFLLSTHYGVATEQFHFQLADVDHMAGEICVTYLSFNDFKQQMIRHPNQPHTIQPKDLLLKTAVLDQSSVAEYRLKFARMVTKRSRAKFNIMKHLSDSQHYSDSNSPLEQLQLHYSFLAYTGEFWLSHTANFTQERTHSWALLKNLVFTEYPLVVKPWIRNDKADTKRMLVEYILNECHCGLIAFSHGTRPVDIPSVGMEDLLIEASSRGNSKVVGCILQFKDSIDSDDLNLSLQGAARGGHLEVVETPNSRS